MDQLRLALLGPPEVFHGGNRLSFALRKAQALLLYLAVEGGMHSRSKLAALLWPDSEASDARRTLRNALGLLRSLLADPTTSTAPDSLSPAQGAHLLSQGELIGLNPQAPLELDLAVVQQAYTAAQRFSTPPSEPQRATLVTQVQQALALVRGPFLDGFWLREETGFDAWHEQQQQQWQMHLQLLCERLSSWQEAGGELEEARATLSRWLALDPLAEEAYQRLMRVHLARGDATAALQVYATCRARLAEELQVKPSADTVALAERIRATAARRANVPGSPARPVRASVESRPPGELVAPLIGRATLFSQLVTSFQQARGGQAQGVLVVGEAGIGKTRLAREFVAWAQAQGAEVLSGHAFEAGGQLPYQPLVELGNFLFAQTGGQPLYLLETLKLLREREWLLPWLATDGSWRLEPSREMGAALAQERTRRTLLPPSVRAMIQARLAKLAPAARQLVMASAVLGSQVSARLLWQLAGLGMQDDLEALEEAVKSGFLREEPAAGGPGVGRLAPYRFAHDLMRDVVYTELGAARRQLLHQRALEGLASEGARASELAYHALLADEDERATRYSVQAGDEALAVFAVDEAIRHYEQARALLQEHVQQLMPAPEVEHLYVCLGRAYAFQNAWQQAQEALEELLAYGQQHQLPRLVSMTLNRLAVLAVQLSKDKSQVRALLEEAWQMAQTSHDQRALAETEWNRAQITAFVWEDPKRAFPHGEHALELARASNDQELEARSLSLLGVMYTIGGDFEEAMPCVEASLALYAALGNEPTASRELSLASFILGAPLTQPLTNRASEALCWVLLAFAQVHAGQVHNSLRSGRMALALSKESKNIWAQISSTNSLTYGLLEAGAYEEALALTQHAVVLARTLPLVVNFHRFLTALGSTYHALQQWEEAHGTLEEAEAVAERLDLGPSCVPALSRLCMKCAVAGEWEQAYRYALKAIAVRKSHDAALIMLDFYPHYETEALLRGGDERQARAEVQRLGERLGSYQRFRLPYLRSLATLAAWHGHSEQAIGHLREAAQLAADLGLPAG